MAEYASEQFGSFGYLKWIRIEMSYLVVPCNIFTYFFPDPFANVFIKDIQITDGVIVCQCRINIFGSIVTNVIDVKVQMSDIVVYSETICNVSGTLITKIVFGKR